MAPEVTIVMPAYNAESTVHAAIESCLSQTMDDWELIVVDDASTDATAEIVSSVEDDRILLLRQTQNRGPGYCRNVALEMTAGRWITVLDADDLYHESRLGTLKEFGEREGGRGVYIDTIAKWPSFDAPPDPMLRATHTEDADGIKRWSLLDWLGHSRAGTPFYETRYLSAGNIRYPVTYRAEDTAFVVRLCRHWRLPIVQLPQSLYVYRREPRTWRGLSAATELGHLEGHRTWLELEREIDPSTERDLHRAIRALRRRAYNRGMYLRTRRTALEDGPAALLRLFAEHPGAIPATVGGIVKRLRGE